MKGTGGDLTEGCLSGFRCHTVAECRLIDELVTVGIVKYACKWQEGAVYLAKLDDRGRSSKAFGRFMRNGSPRVRCWRGQHEPGQPQTSC
jgi:hypothetical protein